MKGRETYYFLGFSIVLLIIPTTFVRVRSDVAGPVMARDLGQEPMI